MDFFETLQKRYSSRQYTAQPVESEKIEKLLEAAQRARPACIITRTTD